MHASVRARVEAAQLATARRGGVVSAHAHMRSHKCIKARAIVTLVSQFQVAMALLKWLCSAVWLICMTSLLHLVLSDGENFVHAE